MVYAYVVTLQNTIRKFIDRFSLLLCSVSAFLFLMAYFFTPGKALVHLLGALVVMALTGINLYKATRKKLPVHYNYVLLISGLVWSSMPMLPWVSLFFLVAGLIEKQAKKNLEIGFADDRIVFNSFPRKKYAWSDFSNIILKDNLLTLDFANNRLFQKETIDEEGDADEEEFNEYCRTQLARNTKTPA